VLRALLWDADGVLQHTPVGWVEALDTAGGPGFAEAVFEAELGAMRGWEPLRLTLQRVLDSWPDARTDVPALLDLWERAVVDQAAMELVGEVRAAGVHCALATNQQDHRREWMRDHLGHDARFDRVYYSCEVGAMKPEPEFFHHILDDLGLPPAAVGFVDDSAVNVQAALDVGLRAVRHDPASGVDKLRDEVWALLTSATQA
jgi:putative hydrolase of the HAD superfamily